MSRRTTTMLKGRSSVERNISGAKKKKEELCRTMLRGEAGHIEQQQL